MHASFGRADDARASDQDLVAALDSCQAVAATPEFYPLLHRRLPLQLFSELLCHSSQAVAVSSVALLAELIDVEDLSEDDGSFPQPGPDDQRGPRLPPAAALASALLSSNPSLPDLLLSHWRRLLAAEANTVQSAGGLEDDVGQKQKSEEKKGGTVKEVVGAMELLGSLVQLEKSVQGGLIESEPFSCLLMQRILSLDEHTPHALSLALELFQSELDRSSPGEARFHRFLSAERLKSLLELLPSLAESVSRSSEPPVHLHESLNDLCCLLSLALLSPPMRTLFGQLGGVSVLAGVLALKKVGNVALSALDSALTDSPDNCIRFLALSSSLQHLHHRLASAIKDIDKHSAKLFSLDLHNLLKVFTCLFLWIDPSSSSSSSSSSFSSSLIDSLATHLTSPPTVQWLIFLFVNFRRSVLAYDAANPWDVQDADDVFEAIHLGRLEAGLPQFQTLALLFLLIKKRQPLSFAERILAELTAYGVDPHQELSLILEEHLAFLDPVISHHRIQRIQIVL